jgi:hypothetical protein
MKTTTSTFSKVYESKKKIKEALQFDDFHLLRERQPGTFLSPQEIKKLTGEKRISKWNMLARL